MVPVVLLFKVIVVIAVPEQAVWLIGEAVTFGVGLTITVALIAAPVQPFVVGIIVNVTVIGKAVALVNVPLISPLPDEGIPVAEPELSLVHENVVPDTVLVSATVDIAFPEHIV